VRVTDHATERAIALDPQLALGEAYMGGRLEVTQGTIYDVLAVLFDNTSRYRGTRWERSLDVFRMAMRRLDQFNPAGRSQRNVEHHYDIDGEIYDLFLDADRQYSCAYFRPGDTLEAAQLAKKRRIAAKLCLAPGQHVLDIGSGWGGLALYLAQVADVDVTGVTLSTAQIKTARDRTASLGLEQRVRFHLEDYRHIKGTFDRIVSVGMFEHVGVNHYQSFFETVQRLLDHDGVVLLHTIGRTDGPGFTNPFIAKYIFPGGYFPALSEIMPAIERSGLVLTDVEVLRLHYAETLKAWRERFMAHREEAVRLKGAPFVRMWEFYLAGSEAAFRFHGLVVFQLQLSRRIDAVPLTRDYIGAAEHDLEARERSGFPLQRMAGE
jgi:cyclopropane-fatty-acyl-phospholipid synthase